VMALLVLRMLTSLSNLVSTPSWLAFSIAFLRMTAFSRSSSLLLVSRRWARRKRAPSKSRNCLPRRSCLSLASSMAAFSSSFSSSLLSPFLSIFTPSGTSARATTTRARAMHSTEARTRRVMSTSSHKQGKSPQESEPESHRRQRAGHYTDERAFVPQHPNGSETGLSALFRRIVGRLSRAVREEAEGSGEPSYDKRSLLLRRFPGPEQLVEDLLLDLVFQPLQHVILHALLFLQLLQLLDQPVDADDALHCVEHRIQLLAQRRHR